MAAQYIFNDLPVLKLSSPNKTRSWKAWLRRFKVNIELMLQKLGKKNVNEQRLDKLDSKDLTLLYSTGEDGLDALDSVSCDAMDANVLYDEVKIKSWSNQIIF